MRALRAGLCVLLLAGCATKRDRWDYRAPDVAAPKDGGPAELADLEDLKATPLTEEIDKAASQMRLKMRDEAFSLGARSGLARRSWEINGILDRHAEQLDRLWNFNAIVIAVPNGDGVIIPPVVERSDNDLRVARDGLSAAAATQILKIVSPARLSSAAPDWRTYLRRQWPTPQIPSGLLLPRSDEEKAAWKLSLEEGWKKGYWQADETFRSDLARLSRDFIGQVRYVGMVRSGEIRELYISKVDLGVTGGGNEMRVGERMVRIAEPARLNNGQWASVVVQPRPEDSPLSSVPDIDSRSSNR